MIDIIVEIKVNTTHTPHLCNSNLSINILYDTDFLDLAVPRNYIKGTAQTKNKNLDRSHFWEIK